MTILMIDSFVRIFKLKKDGWIDYRTYFGTPVDVLCSNFGNLFISDEHSGAIYSVGYGTIPK
jgi:hypothetical protein